MKKLLTLVFVLVALLTLTFAISAADAGKITIPAEGDNDAVHTYESNGTEIGNGGWNGGSFDSHAFDGSYGALYNNTAGRYVIVDLDAILEGGYQVTEVKVFHAGNTKYSLYYLASDGTTWVPIVEKAQATEATYAVNTVTTQIKYVFDTCTSWVASLKEIEIYGIDPAELTCFHTNLTEDGWVAVEGSATCTKIGNQSQACPDCGEVFTRESEAVPALGHDIVTTVTREGTASAYGAATLACSRCDYLIQFDGEINFIDEYYFSHGESQKFLNIIVSSCADLWGASVPGNLTDGKWGEIGAFSTWIAANEATPDEDEYVLLNFQGEIDVTLLKVLVQNSSRGTLVVSALNAETGEYEVVKSLQTYDETIGGGAAYLMEVPMLGTTTSSLKVQVIDEWNNTNGYYYKRMVIGEIGIYGIAKGCGLKAEEHVCEFNEFVEYVVEPTCVENGSATYKCACNATETREVLASEEFHVWDEYVDVRPATCSAQGSETKTCTLCPAQDVTVLEIDPENHEQDYTIESDWLQATCIAEGYYKYTCMHCGEKITTVYEIDTVWGHDYVTEEYIELTCQQNGYEKLVCSLCGAVQENTYEIDPDYPEHVWDDGVAIEGGYYYECTLCDATKEAITAGASNDPIQAIIGENAVVYYVEEEGAVYYYVVTDKAGTVTLTIAETAGIKIDLNPYFMSNYDYSTGETTYTFDMEQAGRCIIAISLDTENYVIPETFSVSFTEKVYPQLVEGENTIEITEFWGSAEYQLTGPGKFTLVSSENASVMIVTPMGASEIENPYSFELLEGETVNFVIMTADYNEGTVVLTLNVIHTHEYTSTTTAPTCKADGYTTYTCTCGHTYTEAGAPALEHNMVETVVPATCTEDGYTSMTCSNGCGLSKTIDATPATGHDWVAATCTEAKTCTACNATEGDALDHNLTAATCTAPVSCTRCDYTEGNALGHDYSCELNGCARNCGHVFTVYYVSNVTDLKNAIDGNSPYVMVNAQKVFVQDGDIVRLSDDIQEEITFSGSSIYVRKNIIIDLNGKTFKTIGTSGSLLMMMNGSLISSSTEKGTLIHTGVNNVLRIYGHVTRIENVNIVSASSKDGGEAGGICVLGSDTNGFGHGYVDIIKNVTVSGYSLKVGIEITSKIEVKNPNVEYAVGKIENVTINATRKGLYIAATCGPVTGSTIYGGEAAISMENISYGGITLAGAVSLSNNVSITGRDCAVNIAGTNIVFTVDEVTAAKFSATNGPALKATSGATATFTVPGYSFADGKITCNTHNYVGTIVPPTCTETGYTTFVCAGCGVSYVGDETPLAAHTVGTAATCTEKAICSVCKQRFGEPNGHTTETEPTCTSPATCTVCGVVTTGAKGHSYSNVVVTSATCTEDGWITITCRNCENTYDSRYDEEAQQYLIDLPYYNLAAKGHSHVAGTLVPATCTAAAYTPYTCACGDTYKVVDESKPATGHDYNYGTGKCNNNCTDLRIYEATNWPDLFRALDQKSSVEFDVVKFANEIEVVNFNYNNYKDHYIQVTAPVIIDLNQQILKTEMSYAPLYLKNSASCLVNGTIEKNGGGRQLLQLHAADLVADVKLDNNVTDLTKDVTGLLIYGNVNKIDNVTIINAHKNGIEVQSGAIIGEINKVSVEAVQQAINVTNGAITKATECTFKSGVIGILVSNLQGDMTIEKSSIDAGSVGLVIKNVYNNADFSFDSATTIVSKGAIYDINGNDIESLNDVVALVNGKLYSDLDEAIAALNASTEEVTNFTLMNDLVIYESIEISKKVNFSLGGATYRIPIYNSSAFEDPVTIPGYTITFVTDDNNASNGVFHVVNGGVLTLSGDGIVNATTASDYSMAIWADGGEVIINGGTYKNVGAGADDQYDLIYVKNGGKVTINGGTFECATPQWTINNHDKLPGTIVVKGGSFVGYNPADSKTEPAGANNNFVAEGYCAVLVNGSYVVAPHVVVDDEAVAPDCTNTGLTAGSHCSRCGEIFVEQEEVEALGHAWDNEADTDCNNNCGFVTVAIGDGVRYETLAEAIANANEVKLIANAVEATAIVVDSEVVLNLNGFSISIPKDTAGNGVFHVIANGKLTINGEGTVNGLGNNNYSIAIWADGGEVIINGGTFTNVGAGAEDHYDLIYVKNGGKVTINGGTFECATPQWTINNHDKLPGTIVVKGGSFVGYNPADSKTEPAGANNNFVAEGYCAVLVNGSYVVAPHVVVDDEAVAPDCTNTGLTAGSHCSRCEAVLVPQEEVDALGHTAGEAVKENENAPTCTEAGSYDSVVYCSVCDAKLSSETVPVNATGHNYVPGETAEDGSVTYTCTNGCNDAYKINNTILNGEYFMQGNSIVFADGVLTMQGDSTTYTYNVTTGELTVVGVPYGMFSVSNGKIYYMGRVELHQHFAENYITEVTEPTCTNKGYTTYICQFCGPLFTADETPALGHSYNTVVTAPTCTAGGYTTYTCSVCGNSYVADETAALGHDYASTTVESTCSVAGYTTYTCACGDTYTVELPLAAHTEVEIPMVLPTPSTQGYTAGVKCSECGETRVAPQPIELTTVSGSGAPMRFRSASLTLQENISVNYALEVNSDFEMIYVIFVFLGEEGEIITDYTINSQNGRHEYKFLGVNPQTMQEKITAYAYGLTANGEWVLNVRDNYSVQAYAEGMYGYNSKLDTVLSDLLVMGAKTQLYMNYKTDALVTDLVEANLKTKLTPSTFNGIDSSLNVQKLVGTKDAVTDWTSGTLELGSSTKMVLKFKTDSIENVEIKITIGDRVETYTKDNFTYDASTNRYELVLSTITVLEFGTTVKGIILKDGVQIGREMNYSINSYLATSYSGTSTAAELVKALYLYGESVNAYFAK